MADIDGKLVKLVMQAVREPDSWEYVLQHLIFTTPAKAAIITLRDKTTCQIVNDDALEQEYHSPLIQGFSFESVVFYLTELRTIDPWAESQRRVYPHRPTLMSKICDPADFEEDRFFAWLRGEGFCDTVAFELDRLPGYWTAINLFLDGTSEKEADKLLEYCHTHFEILREGWQSCQEMLRARQSGDAALQEMSLRSRPACIITPTGELFRSNSAFEELKKNGGIRLIGENQKLCVSPSTEFHGVPGFEPSIVARCSNNEFQLSVRATPISIDPLYKEKKQPYWLLSFVSEIQSNSTKSGQIFEVGILLDQEQELLHALCDGSSVEEAGEKIGVKRARAFAIWSEVKRKLNLKNIHQLHGFVAAYAHN